MSAAVAANGVQKRANVLRHYRNKVLQFSAFLSILGASQRPGSYRPPPATVRMRLPRDHPRTSV